MRTKLKTAAEIGATIAPPLQPEVKPDVLAAFEPCPAELESLAKACGTWEPLNMARHRLTAKAEQAFTELAQTDPATHAQIITLRREAFLSARKAYDILTQSPAWHW